MFFISPGTLSSSSQRSPGTRFALPTWAARPSSNEDMRDSQEVWISFTSLRWATQEAFLPHYDISGRDRSRGFYHPKSCCRTVRSFNSESLQIEPICRIRSRGFFPGRLELQGRGENPRRRREYPVYCLGLSDLIKNREAVRWHKDLEDPGYLKAFSISGREMTTGMQ
jgi:hypothetical protein